MIRASMTLAMSGYTFSAYGDTEKEAQRCLLKGYQRHAFHLFDAAPRYGQNAHGDDIIDCIIFEPVKLGAFSIDGQEATWLDGEPCAS
jgi:hypothetical protein